MGRPLGSKNKTASICPTRVIHAGRWPKKNVASQVYKPSSKHCQFCQQPLHAIDMYSKPLYRCENVNCQKFKARGDARV